MYQHAFLFKRRRAWALLADNSQTRARSPQLLKVQKGNLAGLYKVRWRLPAMEGKRQKVKGKRKAAEPLLLKWFPPHFCLLPFCLFLLPSHEVHRARFEGNAFLIDCDSIMFDLARRFNSRARAKPTLFLKSLRVEEQIFRRGFVGVCDNQPPARLNSTFKMPAYRYLLSRCLNRQQRQERERARQHH